MKKAFAMLFVVALIFAGIPGCAIDSATGKKVLDPQVVAGLQQFGTYAGDFVAGAQEGAPLIIAAATLFGAPAGDIALAQQSLSAADSVVASYKALVATGSGDPVQAQADVMKALTDINQSVGKIKALTDGAKGMTLLHPTT